MTDPKLPAALCGVLLLPALTATLAAQSAGSTRPERVVIRPELPWTFVGDTFEDRVILKFDEGIRVRLVEGRLRSLDGHALDHVVDQLGTGVQVTRLFTRPVEDLDAERARLSARLPADVLPLADLNNYFRLTTPGVDETVRLVNDLNGVPLVEVCYAEPVPVLMGANDIPPPTPDFEGQQGYLGPAPAGFEYRAVRSVVGARFPDNRMAQLEGSWEVGHEDHDHIDPSNYLGSPPSGSYTGSSWRRHGTACVGIMAAANNSYGVTGMGSATSRFFFSSLSNGAANTISLATGALSAGDVMSSSWGWGRRVGGQTVFTPLDFFQSEFDACRTAAAAGIVYTFSAGNSGLRLTDTNLFGNRYLPSAPSSEGFIIGATDGGNTTRASFSNYGSRVDMNGWGRNVATLGYGSLFQAGTDDRQDYTGTFSGTSSAAPCAAGAIAALIGAVKEQNDRVLTVAEVRTAVRNTGTAISGTRNIGTRPNLLQLMGIHGLPDGLLVTQQGTVGGPFTYQVSGNQGEPFGLLFSFGRARTPVGFNRDILIDLGSSFPIDNGTLDATGTHTVTLVLVNDPGLMGQSFYLQGALLRGGNIHVTNSAELWVD